MIKPIESSGFPDKKPNNPYFSMPKGIKKNTGKSFEEVLKEVYVKNKEQNR